MPRKKIEGYVYYYSLDKTKKKNTACRNATHVSNKLFINLTCAVMKDVRRITIRCSNEFNGRIFINRLNDVLRDSNLPKIDKSLVNYSSIQKREVKEDNEKFEEFYDMPEFFHSEKILNSCFFRIDVEMVDIPLMHSLQENFYKYFGQSLFPSKSSFWFPEQPPTLKNKMFITPKRFTPRYPIYIISKGRWEKRHTVRYLEWCQIPYKIIVEEDEFKKYNQYISEENILTIPNQTKDNFKGSIPARNFAWEHSISNGFKRHWILDDNITGYHRFYEGLRILVKSGCVFSLLEDFVDRYENVKMAGHNYTCFAFNTGTSLKPITLNTRIYSSILLSNDIYPEFKWRGVYNEDSDLSLRILKSGYPTLLFNWFLAEKLRTLTQKGGNTDTVYSVEDAMLKKAQSLKEQHPDVVSITTKFKRIHHHIDYSPFKHLKPLPPNTNIKGHNNYGLKLTERDD